MTQERTDIRRYRILGVIGRGGFGHVYRARLEGPEGFTKDVAIKLANKEDVPEVVLQRFRDEARILGLIRDRAIVGVDPPTRLDGRWAVVMEYVDGVSCAKLITRTPFPPKVALELVQEIARALEKAFKQAGPDGAPLEVLHRDLKPGNIQLTPDGEVKLLDFGIARASFAQRESVTTQHIGGTPGYIAPERVYGVEHQAADIYSLGIVLHVLITGEKPTENGYQTRWHEVDRTPAVLEALFLAARMSSEAPEDRPPIREVQDLCAQLRGRLPGDNLRHWAERMVPEALRLNDDDLVGNVLTETFAAIPLQGALPTQTTPFQSPKRSRLWLLAAVVVPALLISFMAAGAGILWAQTERRFNERDMRRADEIARLRAEIEQNGAVTKPTEGTSGEGSAEVQPGEGSTAEVPSSSPAPPARPASKPRAAPAPPPANARRVKVRVSGDAEAVWLVADGQRIRVSPSGSAPAGSWQVVARFGGKEVRAGRVRLRRKPVSLRCTSFVKQCRPK